MSTQQQFFTNSTPLNKHIVKALGLVKGAVACKIIYASSLRDGVCRMGLSRMADELGIDKSTVSKNITLLKKDGYLNLLLSASDTHPAHLKPSEKLMGLLDIVDDVNPPVDKVNPPVDDINTPVDKVNQDKKANKSKDKNTNNVTPNGVSAPQKSSKTIPIKEKEKPKRPPAVDTYRKVANRFPDKATWPLLERVTDLEFWEQVIRHWIACGWNKLNVKGMLEFYDRRELPTAKKNGVTDEQPPKATRRNLQSHSSQDENSQTWRSADPNSNAAAIARVAKQVSRTSSNGT